MATCHRVALFCALSLGFNSFALLALKQLCVMESAMDSANEQGKLGFQCGRGKTFIIHVMFKSLPVSRDCVQTLHSRDTWLKEARTVRLGEEPYKARYVFFVCLFVSLPFFKRSMHVVAFNSVTFGPEGSLAEQCSFASFMTDVSRKEERLEDSLS